MNTIKITKIHEMLTERHNLENTEIIRSEINGIGYQFYAPCNLNIYIGPKCNCNCNFCFASGFNKSEDINDDEYLSSLEKSLDKLKEIPIEITITGGEPSLYPKRLIKVMELLKDRGLSQRTLSTNGIGLQTRVNGKPLLQYMKENEFVHNINLSRMSIDEEKNRKIFNGVCLTNGHIRKIAAFTDLNNMDLRLSCNLIEGEVDSWKRIYEYIEFYMNNGISSFIFRELAGCQATVLMEKIVEEMFKEAQIKYLKTMEGIFYTINIYQLGDKLIKHYKQKYPNHAPIANLVFHNGKLLCGWNGNIL